MAANFFGIKDNEEQSHDMQKYLDSLNNESSVKEANNKENLLIESDEWLLSLLNKIYNEITEIKVILNGLENKK